MGVISILRFGAPFQPIRDPHLDFGAFGSNQWVRAAQIELNRDPYLIFHGPRETSLELLHHGYAAVCVREVITWRSQLQAFAIQRLVPGYSGWYSEPAIGQVRSEFLAGYGLGMEQKAGQCCPC